jgi:parallel beta-helix repeat protein
MRTRGTVVLCFLLIAAVECRGPAQNAPAGPRTIHAVQSGTGDVVGNDNAALQKAADMLRPGDTLEIGPGTWTMHNSLFVPSKVTVRGVPGQTILKKAAGVESALAEDGDYGEGQLRVREPQKFQPGMGVSVLDDRLGSGWDVSVTTVTAVEGNLLRLHPMTQRDYDSAAQHARVHNTFPILCANNTEGVTFEGITVDGNKEENPFALDGCRGGAIYAYISKDLVIRNCVAKNYNGDGISVQITDNVQILDCESFGHTGLGVHPGTGSDRPTVKNCRIHDNGEVGLFLCWRVRHGQFTDNIIERNKYGISIGHKDTDNVFTNNTVSGNSFCGVLFREETFENSGHRNTFQNNKILDNGNPKEGYGFYILPHAGDLVIANNQIAETRADKARTQRYGIFKAAGAGALKVDANTITGCLEKDIIEGVDLKKSK